VRCRYRHSVTATGAPLCYGCGLEGLPMSAEFAFAQIMSRLINTPLLAHPRPT
jgi:hypothetical protein